jgi:hypothetical protein
MAIRPTQPSDIPSARKRPAETLRRKKMVTPPSRFDGGLTGSVGDS